MNSFKVRISLGNSAFEDQESEIARILREIAQKVENGNDCANIHDINGNHVGWWELNK